MHPVLARVGGHVVGRNRSAPVSTVFVVAIRDDRPKIVNAVGSRNH